MNTYHDASASREHSCNLQEAEVRPSLAKYAVTSPCKMATAYLASGKTLTKRNGNVKKLSIVELFRSGET